MSINLDFYLCGDALRFAFNQDKVLITAQMNRIPDGGRHVESLAIVSFMGDTVPLRGRRMILDQIASEQSTTAARRADES